MTYREALLRILTDEDVKDILRDFCPRTEPENCALTGCIECWNREMPKEEDNDNV